MLFNFNETSYKVRCWAVVVEALGGMVGALCFFSLRREGHLLKDLDWACLWLKLHFLLKFRRPFFFYVHLFFLTIKRSRLWENPSHTSLEELVGFFGLVFFCCFLVCLFLFKLAKQGTRNTWICDEPKCEIHHSNFVYCSALWCSLILGNWVLDLDDSEILVQINLC